jgi:hypothetical protein
MCPEVPTSHCGHAWWKQHGEGAVNLIIDAVKAAKK